LFDSDHNDVCGMDADSNSVGIIAAALVFSRDVRAHTGVGMNIVVASQNASGVTTTRVVAHVAEVARSQVQPRLLVVGSTVHLACPIRMVMRETKLTGGRTESSVTEYGRVMYLRSMDGGKTWSVPKDIPLRATDPASVRQDVRLPYPVECLDIIPTQTGAWVCVAGSDGVAMYSTEDGRAANTVVVTQPGSPPPSDITRAQAVAANKIGGEEVIAWIDSRAASMYWVRAMMTYFGLGSRRDEPNDVYWTH